MRRFWAKKCRRDHLRSLWRSVVLMTVRRWQRSAAAEERWGSLTKCGITKLVTVRRGNDGPSCRFVVKFREVIPEPDSKSWSIFERRTSTDHCGYDGPSCRFVVKIREVILIPRFQELKYFETRPSTDRCAYDGPSHLPSRGMKKAADEIAPSMGQRSPQRSVMTITVRRVVHRPSRVLADFQ